MGSKGTTGLFEDNLRGKLLLPSCLKMLVLSILQLAVVGILLLLLFWPTDLLARRPQHRSIILGQRARSLSCVGCSLWLLPFLFLAMISLQDERVMEDPGKILGKRIMISGQLGRRRVGRRAPALNSLNYFKVQNKSLHERNL